MLLFSCLLVAGTRGGDDVHASNHSRDLPGKSGGLVMP
jgi:hypothetical protein